MKFQSTGLQEYGTTKVGMTRGEQCGSKMRRVLCKAIHLGDDGKHYAMWQFITAKTGKVSGKSSAWLTEIKENQC